VSELRVLRKLWLTCAGKELGPNEMEDLTNCKPIFPGGIVFVGANVLSFLKSEPVCQADVF
jgi:hypothetical protein